MGEIFNKIAIVCLDDSLAESTAKTLSENLGMMFCSTKDLLEYELSDVKNMASVTCEEYLLQSENRVFRQIASFCDVVISLTYDNFSRGYKTISQNCILVFLKIQKSRVTDKINKIMFTGRNTELQEKADVVVSVKNETIDKICEKIVEKLAKKL